MAFPKRLTEKTHRGRVARREPDVFDLVPPTFDTVYLERLMRLGPEPSPFARLLAWEPEEEDDQHGASSSSSRRSGPVLWTHSPSNRWEDNAMKKRTPERTQPTPPPIIVSLDRALALAHDLLIQTGGQGRRWVIAENALLSILHMFAFQRTQRQVERRREQRRRRS